MGERERILELVREGVLSVDEALDLLENVANKESKKSEQKEFTTDSLFEEVEKEARGEAEKEEAAETDTESESEGESEEATSEMNDAEDMKQFEEELEGLANDLNQYSVEIDTLNEELTDLRAALTTAEDTLNDRKETMTEDYEETKAALEADVINLQKEIELISAMDEVDSTEEVRSLNKDLTTALEELRALENEAATDEEIKDLEEEVEALRGEIKEVNAEKNKLLKEVHSIKMKQWTTKAKQMSENLDIPEEWREGANKTFNKASDIFGETSKTLGDVFRQTVRTTKDTLENIDWKDIDVNFNFPREAKVQFEHEWLFEDTTATILDFKNANGDIQFKPSMNENIKINAKIKIHGDVEEATPLDAFEARSVVKIDEDKFTFHVPNKKVVADMIIYLPEREYDYVRSNSFNGDVSFYEVNARDIYVKATNGGILLDNLQATMLEVKGTNGNITLKNAELRDLLISTVNGDVRVIGYVQSSDINTTNGDIRLTLSGEELIRVAGGSVNGDVKISLPKETGLEVEAKSTFGKVKSRLSNIDSALGKSRKGNTHSFRRIGTGDICRINVQTTTGNVLFKDSDK
jgi:DUF4097 and DUF4098 domain-containing protein YvlB